MNGANIFRVFIGCVILGIFAAAGFAGPVVWTEDTFEDFRDGTLDAGGHNLYVCHDGTVRTILRFDINDDGYLDLFFGNTHDTRTHVPPVACRVGADRAFAAGEMGVMGSDRVQAADFNNDGFTDLAFCLKLDGLQIPRRFVYLVYGGADGWPAHRTTGHLPVMSPLDMAVADLNGDGWQDIAVLNGGDWISQIPMDRNITIFWGSKNGFILTRQQQIGHYQAIRLLGGDFDGDGMRDLAALGGDGKIRIFWAKQATENSWVDFQTTLIVLPCEKATCFAGMDANHDGAADFAIGTGTEKMYLLGGKGGREWQEAAEIAGYPASHLAAGNLDGDAYPDLIVTNFSSAQASLASVVGSDENVVKEIQILWGGAEGYSSARATALAAKYAYATAIGDADRDGTMDVAVAIYQGDQTFEGKSIVYFGKGGREFTLSGQTIATAGATDAVVLESPDKNSSTLVFCNSSSGALGEKTPAYVYWGDKKGFDVKRRWEIPGQSVHEGTAADLNADGYVDLAITNTIHGGEAALKNPIVGLNIHWGGKDGFDFDKQRTVLHEPWMCHCHAADLNRDGFLDVVLGGWDQGFDAKSMKPAEVAIYYGSAEGYAAERRVAVPVGGSSEVGVVADFNQDEYLDIGLTSAAKNCTRILWGGAEGYDATRQQQIFQPMPIAMEAADLNNDGFLDLMVGCYMDEVSGVFDTGTYIYWGSRDGYKETNSYWLPGQCTLFYAVADYDNDGYLDIFGPDYHGQLNREELASHFYWNGPNGFDSTQKTAILCNSAADAFAGDFDGDGRIDIAISNHTTHGNHRTNSKVLYNDGRRFADPKTVYLPTLGSHYMYLTDMGHIYNRKYRQVYTSSVFEWNQAAQKGEIAAEAQVRKGSTLTFAVRSAESRESLSSKPWVKIKKGFALQPGDRVLQYQAIFESKNGDRYPVLDKVVVTLK